MKNETYAASFLQLGIHTQVFKNNDCYEGHTPIQNVIQFHIELSYKQNCMHQP